MNRTPIIRHVLGVGGVHATFLTARATLIEVVCANQSRLIRGFR